MSSPVWVVQSNLGNSDDYRRLLDACTHLGMETVPYNAIPFSDELPDVSTRPPTVFYGATRFITNVAHSRRWRPGVYFEPEAFSVSACLEHWGERMLNSESRFTTLSELARETLPDDRLLFVRPRYDNKSFAGEVTSFGELRDWVSKLSEDCLLAPDTPIAVADPVFIAHEWRLFLVAGEVVAGSRYRSGQRLDIAGVVPPEVSRWAEETAALWSPAPVFVLDVAQCGGHLYAVEANCFHSAGFYASDVGRIVATVSEYVAQNETLAD